MCMRHCWENFKHFWAAEDPCPEELSQLDIWDGLEPPPSPLDHPIKCLPVERYMTRTGARLPVPAWLVAASMVRANVGNVGNVGVCGTTAGYCGSAWRQ